MFWLGVDGDDDDDAKIARRFLCGCGRIVNGGLLLNAETDNKEQR